MVGWFLQAFCLYMRLANGPASGTGLVVKWGNLCSQILKNGWTQADGCEVKVDEQYELAHTGASL